TTAVADGARERTANSQTYKRALARKAAGTNTAGVIRADHRAEAPTSSIEKTAVAMSIIGSAVGSREVRNNASRVAFPLINCAMTAAAQHIAMNVERDLGFMTFAW